MMFESENWAAFIGSIASITFRSKLKLAFAFRLSTYFMGNRSCPRFIVVYFAEIKPHKLKSRRPRS